MRLKAPTTQPAKQILISITTISIILIVIKFTSASVWGVCPEYEYENINILASIVILN